MAKKWTPPAPIRRTAEQLEQLEQGIKAAYTDRSQDTLIKWIGKDQICWSYDTIMIKQTARSQWQTIAVWRPESNDFWWTDGVEIAA